MRWKKNKVQAGPFYFRRYERGQTFAEIITTTAVVVILASILVLYNRNTELSARLVRDRQKMILTLRRAQDFALNTREFQGATPCAYGIHFTDAGSHSEYVLFADLPSGPTCPGNSQRAGGNSSCDPLGPEDIECIHLERGVEFVAPASNDILFVPPQPIVINPAGPAQPIIIRLAENPSISLCVQVTSAGEIGTIACP